MTGDSQPPAKSLVWILADSVAACERVAEVLAKLGRRPDIELVLTACGLSTQTAPADAVAAAPTLCATVLVIEAAALENPQFRHWADWCRRQVARRDDFRLFVHLDRMDMAELVRRAHDGDNLLADLRDTVQLVESRRPDQMTEELDRYLRQLAAIRGGARWRLLWVEAATTAGWIATVGQVTAGVILAMLAVAAWRGFGRQWVPVAPPEIGGLLCGLPVFPLTSVPMFFLARGPARTNVLLASNPALGWWMAAFVVGAGAILSLQSKLGWPSEWLALGVVIGALLDITRRAGRQAQRNRRMLEGASATPPDNPLPARVEEAIRGNSPHPMTCSLFPPDPPRIFISYARASDWCSRAADELFQGLHRQGVDVFLDRQGIPEGGNWRRQLNRKLAEVNLIICLADSISVKREWVAAEVETALVGAHWTGLPEVIVLIHPDVARHPGPSCYPVFRAVLSDAGLVQRLGEPRRILVKASTVKTVASQFDSYGSAGGALFPSGVVWLLRGGLLPVVVISPFGIPIGLLAGVLCLVHATGMFRVFEFLASGGLLGLAALLCSYWLGFVTRFALAVRLEFQTETRVSAAGGVWAALGLAAFVGYAISYLPIIWVGWAVPCAGLGWMLAQDFVHVVWKVRPESRVPNY